MGAKIIFKGNPPMMDFTLVKLTGGQNLIDNQSRGIYSLGEGELTKIVTDAGQALRRSLEATLKEMKPNQMIRVQILMHGHVGYAFLPPHSYSAPTFGDKVRFAFGESDDNDNNVILARGRENANSDVFRGVDQVNTFIVVADNDQGDSIIEVGDTKIKHAKAGDNEDSSNGEIINAH